MPNYQGVWDITTQFQYAAEWPVPILSAGRALFAGGYGSDYSNVIDFNNII